MSEPLRTLPTPSRRSLGTPLILLALAALVVASFATLRLDLAAFFTPEAVTTTLEFLAGFAPPETATPFLLKTLEAAIETLSMSALGTLLAVLAGLVLALSAAGFEVYETIAPLVIEITRKLMLVLSEDEEQMLEKLILRLAGEGLQRMDEG